MSKKYKTRHLSLTFNFDGGMGVVTASGDGCPVTECEGRYEQVLGVTRPDVNGGQRLTGFILICENGHKNSLEVWEGMPLLPQASE